jgi:hypothetical protein
MKYIFVTGAPGSKWSSVVKNIYYSSSVDRSDSSLERTYRDELHLGAYWVLVWNLGRTLIVLLSTTNTL